MLVGDKARADRLSSHPKAARMAFETLSALSEAGTAAYLSTRLRDVKLANGETLVLTDDERAHHPRGPGQSCEHRSTGAQHALSTRASPIESRALGSIEEATQIEENACPDAHSACRRGRPDWCVTDRRGSPHAAARADIGTHRQR